MQKYDFASLQKKISTLLITTPSGDTHSTILSILEQCSIAYDADRVRFSLYESENNLILPYDEWCILPEYQSLPQKEGSKIDLQKFNYWSGLINQRQSFILNTLNELPDEAIEEKKILKENKVRSVMTFPIYNGEMLLGSISLESIANERTWTPVERDSLSEISSMISSHFMSINQEWNTQSHERDTKLTHDDSPPLSLNDTDLTRKMKILSDAALQLFKLNTREQIFKFTAEILYQLLNDPFIVITEYIKDEGILQVRSTKGINTTVEKLTNILGIKILGHSVAINEDFDSLSKSGKLTLRKIDGGIHEVGMGTVSKGMARIIETIIGIKGVYGCGFYANNQLFSTALIVLRNDHHINHHIIDSFAQMVSMSLSRLDTLNELLKSQQEKKDILDNMSEGVIRTNINGEILFANKTLLEIFGNSEKELIGKNILTLAISPDEICQDTSLSTKNGNDLLTKSHSPENSPLTDADYQQINSFTTEYITRQGKKKTLRIRGRKIFEKKAENNSFLCVVSDITEAQATEMHLMDMEINQRTDDVKKNFLSNMSHEMLTPINGITGISELLMESDLSQDHKDLIAIMGESGQQLLKTIESIWETLALKEGTKQIVLSDFWMCDLLNHNSKLFGASALKKNLKLRLECNQINHMYFRADEFKINQVLSNLIGNAIKFSKQGCTVSVKTSLNHDETSQTSRLRFDITDEGVGIPREKQHIIFNMFEQADNSFTRNHDGLGLGLHISQKLVNIMQGSIGFISSEKSGSNFWFDVPVELLEGTNHKTDCSCIQDSNDKQRILVLTNKSSVKKVMEVVLSQLNVKADFAFSILDAKKSFNPDLHQLILASPETISLHKPLMSTGYHTGFDTAPSNKLAGKQKESNYQTNQYNLLMGGNNQDSNQLLFDDLLSSFQKAENYSVKIPPILAMADKETCYGLLGERSKLFDDFISNPFSSSILHEKLEKWMG